MVTVLINDGFEYTNYPHCVDQVLTFAQRNRIVGRVFGWEPLRSMAMGDLITFRPSSNSTRQSGAAKPLQDARILFFTGVRYNREAEPTPVVVQDVAPPKGGMDGTGGGRRKRRG
jgi:hypothetical protein